jgi:hypothetical protein
LIHFDSITFPTYLGRLALEVGLFGFKNIPKPKMVSHFGPLNNKALFRHLEVWKWLVGGHFSNLFADTSETLATLRFWAFHICC